MIKRLLLISVMVLSLVGTTSCGNSSQEPESTDASGQTTSQAEDTLEEAESGQEENTNIENAETTLNETTIYDNNDVIVIVNGLSSDSYGKYIDLTITNNSDRDISWTVFDIMINDITTMCAVSYDISAGKTGKGEYPLNEEEMEKYGITDIHTLQLNCELNDAGTYENIDRYTSERLVTNLGPEFDLSLPLDEWDLVYDSESIKIYYTGLIEEGTEYDEFKTKADFICFNELDSAISVMPEDVSFDETMDYSNYYSFNVGPKAYGEFYLTCEDDIAEKGGMSFKFVVNDTNSLEEILSIDNISVEMK